MIKNYVIDTNVIIHDPSFLERFKNNNIIIPIMVIEELDNKKKAKGMVGYNARMAARKIKALIEDNKNNFNKGIKLPNGGTVRVELDHLDMSTLPDAIHQDKYDNKILAVTLNLQNEDKEKPTILVTKDIYMTIKAISLGLKVEDYQNDKIMVKELYKGYDNIMLESKKINEIYQDGVELPEEYKKEVYPNMFFEVHSVNNINHSTLVRYDGKKLVPLKYSNETSWGLRPINREQYMAYELLMDPNIHFVTIAGGAGSGKTILSTSVALQKVIDEEIYDKIVFVRPVVPAGNDIGFLPGSEDEKLKPWMGSFYDSINNLYTGKNHKKESNKSDNKFTVDDFIDMYRQIGVIETKTLTYMRGRTFNRSLVIVDEAQEITPHLAKLMLTRAGFDSKFVFIGDPSDNQIDNTLVDSKSNGLVYTIEKMKPYDITGHIQLKQVERSPLAKLAEKYM
ncbi:MAG: PhoH family protein [archaeon]